MKIGIVTQLNTKGQIVIPKKFRDQMNLVEGSNLNINVVGNDIVINVLPDIIPDRIKQNEFTKILEETSGSWGSETQEEKKQKEKNLKH